MIDEIEELNSQSYPVREAENEKIRELLKEGIEGDRLVFKYLREGGTIKLSSELSSGKNR